MIKLFLYVYFFYIVAGTLFWSSSLSRSFWYGAAGMLALGLIEILDELGKIRTTLNQIRYVKVKQEDWR